MKFSTKTRYGLRAMIEITKATEGHGVFQKDIAVNQDISVKYLDHIIHSLKAARLIINMKGKGSGYTLTRPPEEISILDIHNAFESGICVIDCLSENFNCERHLKCETKDFWLNLNALILDYFKKTTLSDLINNKRYS